MYSTLTGERQSIEMRRSTTTTTHLIVQRLPKDFEPWLVWGAACRGKGMDGLGQSPFAAVVLLCRVWIDNSMRHQNGRSRAAVASSLLLRLVSSSLLTQPLQGPTKLQLLFPVVHSPALSVVHGALCMCIRVSISIAKGKIRPDGLRQRNATAKIIL